VKKCEYEAHEIACRKCQELDIVCQKVKVMMDICDQDSRQAKKLNEGAEEL
jgi:hypothetical protein